MAENPRIEELRRRVQKDPASIAFAQLAEEYRRSGNYEDAIAICRTGLKTHPSYLSARVTLGRALIEMNDLDNAEGELRYVLQHAAENLAAIRAMAEIHHRRGELNEALGFYKSALELARHDPDLEQTVDEISRTISKASAPAPQAVPAPVVEPPPESPALTSEQATAEFLKNTFDLLELDPLDLEPASVEPAVMEQAAEPLKAIAPVAPVAPVAPDAPDAPVAPVAPDAPPELVGAMEPIQAMEQFQDDDFVSVEMPIEIPFEMPLDMPLEMPMIANPALAGLERFLGAIHSYRQRRAV